MNASLDWNILEEPARWGLEAAEAFRHWAGVWHYDLPSGERQGKVKRFQEMASSRIKEAKQREQDAYRKLMAEMGHVDLDHGADRPEKIDWIIEDVIAPYSPAGIGGSGKSHKSSIATELALVASSSDYEEPSSFLDQFKGPESASAVYYLNLEGTDGEFRDRLKRIEKARGIRANRDALHVLQRFPPLNTDSGLDKLESLIDLSGETGGVLIVDSLYVALAGSDFTRQAVIGGHLAAISEICHASEITPIYVHHFKSGGRSGLDAFSGTGLQQHVGQWLLLHKTGRYDAEEGRQQYRMEIGGRHGGGGVFALNVAEGRLSNAGGRCWETSVATHVRAESNLRQTASNNSKLAEAVLATIQSNQGITRTGLGKEIPKRSAGSLRKAVETLLQTGAVIEIEVINRGNVTKGYCTPDKSPDSPPTSRPLESGK